MGCLTLAAQETKTEYVFTPHWYIQIQPAGAQYTLGETSFNDLVSYNAQLAVGYNFNSIVGARLSVNAWQSKGGWEMDGADYNWKWKYVSPMADITANLSNLICGFNPNRFFNFSVFAGIGANIAWDNDEAAEAKTAIQNYYKTQAVTGGAYDAANNQNMRYLWDGTKTRLAGHAGIMADFRISDAVSVGLEVQANTTNDHYNSKKAGNADWYFNALAGVKINLGKTYTTRTVTTPERVVEKVVERVVEKPAPAPQVQAKAEVAKAAPIRRNIFFKLNSSRISAAELYKVEEVASYMKDNPDSKAEIVGYADKRTGNASINSRISAKRAQAIVAALVNKGISSSRITSSSKGDKEQPFTTNSQNRVCICIAQ